jgi:hypothetical protein
MGEGLCSRQEASNPPNQGKLEGQGAVNFPNFPNLPNIPGIRMSGKFTGDDR